MIRFTCPKCDKHLKAPPEYAGKHVKCMRCGHSITAPAPDQKPGPSWLEPPETVGLADPDRAAPTALRQNPQPKRMSPRLLGLGIGAAVLVIAGVVLAYVLLAPSRLDQALLDLRTSDPARSKSALQWLSEQDPLDAQRPKVTAALEVLIVDGDVHKNLDPDLVLRVYLAWADKDNAAAMTRMVQNPTMPNWSSQKTALVMTALAKLGDERAFPALAEKLADPKLHDQALNALRVAGPKSKNAVVAMAFDDNPDTRLRAQTLLDEFGASPKLIADEAFARLKSPQADVRRSAIGWFVKNSPNDGAQKAEGAKLLGKLLLDQSAKVSDKVLHALKTWAAKDCLPDLVEYARRDQKTVAGNPELLEVLARFPDPSAAEAMALQLTNSNTRAKAAQALLKLGPVADNAVLQYINDPDLAVQKEARALSRLLKISDDRQLDQTLKDVADSRIARSRAALHHLAQIRPDDASRAKVSKALNATLLEPTRGLSDESLNALIVWSSPENVDTLLKMLGPYDKSGMGRNARVIEFLGALKDPRAAAALAPGLEHGRERSAVSKALKVIGAAAQNAVFPYLDSLNEATCIEACRILGEIGTDKSLDPLQKAYRRAGGDPVFSQELQVAMQRIMARK
jgi:hypothetical protein